jgi:hypothetical protein
MAAPFSYVMPPGTVPTPQLRQPSSNVEGSPRVVRRPSNVHSGAAHPTRHRRPSESRTVQAQLLRGDRSYSTAIASMADAATGRASARRAQTAAAVPASDRRGDDVGLACPQAKNRKGTQSRANWRTGWHSGRLTPASVANGAVKPSSLTHLSEYGPQRGQPRAGHSSHRISCPHPLRSRHATVAPSYRCTPERFSRPGIRRLGVR